MKTLERNVDVLLPEKYKFLDLYDSLKEHIKLNFNTFTSSEKTWFHNEYSLNDKKKRNFKFLEMIPYIVKKKHCVGIIFALFKESGMSLSEIATQLGIRSSEIDRAKRLLEGLKLIIIKYEIPGTTKCYLNDGNLKSNGDPPLPTILSIFMKMMEEEHGKSNIKKFLSVNINVQNNILKKYRKKEKVKL